jgi:hypothetical protein
VLKGRAIWLDEGHRSIQLITGSSEKQEEIKMPEEHVYPNNGKASTAPVAEPTEADAVLLYQAKLNVKDKRNLVRHVIAYIAVWPVFALLYGVAFVTDAQALDYEGWLHLMDFARDIIVIPHEYWQWYDMIYRMEQSRHLQTLPVWYFIMGMMAAWGGWIAFRIIKRIVKKKRTHTGKRIKPDPVMQEYNRLKQKAENEAY